LRSANRYQNRAHCVDGRCKQWETDVGTAKMGNTTGATGSSTQNVGNF
jgi:hypothetical protein